ncbi:response regulator [Sphingomonas sp. STIS6.2]|uniref:response regulator n=1 Tax=Sphingomonas sp. STIS6.2 TaxID=1379700 RepID=UPI0004DB74C8|nr:response regulator [Sphingomonas sp. STIS6.2]
MGQSKPINSRSILVVEDEALIRFNLIDYFENAGFTVYDAENADGAISILVANSSIRVVLTDVQMPGSMDGLRLAHHIRSRFPPTILFITSGVISLGERDMPADSFFLPKPFNPRSVVRTIDGLRS